MMVNSISELSKDIGTVLNVRQGSCKLQAERNEVVNNQQVKARINEDHGQARASACSLTMQTGSDARTGRTQQQQGSSGYFQIGVSMIRGLVAPTQMVQHPLQKRDEERLRITGVKNQELYEAFLEYRTKAKAQAKQLEHMATVNEVQAQEKKILESRNQRLAEEAMQHSYHAKQTRDAAEKAIAAAKQKVTALQDKGEFVAKSCRDYEKQIERLESTIRNMQAARLHAVESAQWAPLPTSEIEHRLKVLHSGVRQWAESNTGLTLEQVLDPERFNSTLQALMLRGCILPDARLRECLLQNRAMRTPGKASQVLLAAAVSFDILFKIIGDPLFAFVGGMDDCVLRKCQGTDIKVLLELIRKSDEAGAEALRCQLLRLLDPPIAAEAGSSVAFVKDLVKESRRRALIEVVNSAIGEFMGPLSKEQYAHAYKGLEVLVQDACELSWALWTRKARVEVHNWSSINQIHSTSYKSTSDLFEVHPLHKRDLEDTPEALDGRSITLLCAPLVLVAGNAEGEQYENKAILKKAIVWIG